LLVNDIRKPDRQPQNNSHQKRGEYAKIAPVTQPAFGSNIADFGDFIGV
jgi:hypothetical protein